MTAHRFRAPGRVNLMGDHTDYNDGFVLPMAIELECVVAVEPRDDGTIHAVSAEIDGALAIPADGSADPAAVAPPWGRYVAGVARALAERRRSPVGATMSFASSVPVGSGLSSSAALEVASALALCAVADLSLSVEELALACQRAEHLATGVPSGIMDQLASLAALDGAALLVDCRDLSRTHVTVPEELAVLVVHSGVARTLEGSAYGERRAACETLAHELGLSALRDATPEEVREHPLGRHVVSENHRVHATAQALAEGDVETLGALFAASHASLRDDYAVSTPELDALVAALVAAGAIGARLTGAGFGGAVVSLSHHERVHAVAAAATGAYSAATGRKPRAWVSRPAAGAGPVEGKDARARAEA